MSISEQFRNGHLRYSGNSSLNSQLEIEQPLTLKNNIGNNSKKRRVVTINFSANFRSHFKEGSKTVGIVKLPVTLAFHNFYFLKYIVVT